MRSERVKTARKKRKKSKGRVTRIKKDINREGQGRVDKSDKNRKTN